MNKFLNILAWVAFLLGVISYALDDVVPVEAIYCVLSGIFFILAPRSFNEVLGH